MSTQSLRLFQAGFAAALASGDPLARPQGLVGEAADRFRVYRNNFFHGVGQQLGEAYPVVRRLVGEAFFLATARAFLEDFPPAASLPYLADVARLERAWLEALHAAGAAPLAPADLIGPGDALAGTRLVAHPAARIVTSDHAIYDLWHASQSEADAGPFGLRAVAQSTLVTRPDLRVELRALSPAQSPFVRALFAGAVLDNAFEAATARDQAFDLTATFRDLLAAGAFTQMEASTAR